MKNLARTLSIAQAVLTTLSASAIVVGQEDDFQSGTLMGWAGGADPTLVADGGPLGSGDAFLRITSTGASGPGGNLATHNAGVWAGAYGAAGVGAVEADVVNLGGTDLSLRIVLYTGAGSGRWTSTEPVAVPAGGGWHRVAFPLAEASLTRVLGTQTYSQMIGSVDQIMIRHQSGPPASGGTNLAGVLGIDNVTASAGRRIAGTVTLEDFAGTAPGEALVEFRNPGEATVIRTEAATLDANGAFSVFAPPVPGQYDASIKVSHWLRRTLAADTTAGDATGLAFSLPNGDVDGDNVVTVFDYNALSDAFDSAEGDAHWSPDADLDGDGAVTVFDYNVLSANFDQSGDE